MIVSVFSDGERKDKIAEFYDTLFPTSFLRGVLEESREDETEAQLFFVCRPEIERIDMPIPKMELKED